MDDNQTQAQSYIIFPFKPKSERAIRLIAQQHPDEITYISFGKHSIGFIYYTSIVHPSILFGEFENIKWSNLPSNCFLFPISDFPSGSTPETVRQFTITPSIVTLFDIQFYSFQYFPPGQTITKTSDQRIRDRILENHYTVSHCIPFNHFTCLPIAPFCPEVVTAVQNHALEWGINHIEPLHFTGAIYTLQTPEEIEILAKCGEEAIREIQWPENKSISFPTFNVFGSPERPYVIWLSMDGEMANAYIQWNLLVAEKARDNGILPLKVQDQFHMTIVKGKNLPDATKIIQTVPNVPQAEIREFQLVSRIHNNGFYSLVHAFPIQ